MDSGADMQLRFAFSWRPSVRGLFFRCRPSTVLRRIGTIVVRPSIKGVLGAGPPPHVFKEVLERVQPTVADRDATSAISGITGFVRVGASCPQAMPADPFRRRRTADCFSVPQARERLQLFSPDTATTSDTAIAQVLPSDTDTIAAVAEALPKDGAIRGMTLFTKDGKPIESLTEEVNLRGHREPTFSVSCPRLFVAVRGLFRAFNYTSYRQEFVGLAPC